ncbi:MAG: hypothetical protein C4584_00475 [Armatimonadetes bacterium]|nr:MAG: hypothetical protein C4584_00475 [Armatimonadota bacterium]
MEDDLGHIKSKEAPVGLREKDETEFGERARTVWEVVRRRIFKPTSLREKVAREKTIDHRDRRLVVAGIGAVAFGVLAGGIKYVADRVEVLAEERKATDLHGKSREQGIVFKEARLSSMGKGKEVEQPIVVRKGPDEKEPEVGREVLKEKGIDIDGDVRGYACWGGPYNSGDDRGRVFEDKYGRKWGKWMGIVNGSDEIGGYVAENFVTYGENLLDVGSSAQASK